LIQKKKDGKTLLEEMLPRIISLEEMSKFIQLLNTENYGFIREKRGVRFSKYGDTQTWWDMLSVIQKKIKCLMLVDQLSLPLSDVAHQNITKLLEYGNLNHASLKFFTRKEMISTDEVRDSKRISSIFIR